METIKTQSKWGSLEEYVQNSTIVAGTYSGEKGDWHLDFELQKNDESVVITLKTSFYGEHNFPSFKGEGGEDGVHTFTNLKDAKDFIDNQREDFISKSHNVG